MQKKHILLAEDDPAIRKALSTVIDKLGYAVQVATNGQEALRLVSEQDFDLILLDVLMPFMNGMEFLKDIRSKGLQTKVIIISNIDYPEDLETAKSLGVEHYLIKRDTSLDDLRQVIAETLAS